MKNEALIDFLLKHPMDAIVKINVDETVPIEKDEDFEIAYTKTDNKIVFYWMD